VSGHRRTRGRPRNTEADTAILDSALDLLIERGVDGASIEQIARQAGVTRATVYRRFPDKSQLLIAAIHHGYNLPDGRTDLPELAEPRDVEEMLSWWARAIAGPERRRTRRMIRRLMFSLHDHPELSDAFAAVSVKPRDQWIHAVLDRERARGRFPADTDVDVVQQILTGAIATHLLTQPDDSTAQQAEDFLLAVLRETRYRSNP
jgi:AcrR family transcriptional regulator